MKLWDVLYYYYFVFYKKIIRDNDPHFGTVTALGCSQALLLNGTMDIIALNYFCFKIMVAVQFLIAVIIIGINYLVFHKTGRAHTIIKSKPALLNNKVLSLVVSVLFFLITTSWLFWGSFYGKYLLERCK